MSFVGLMYPASIRGRARTRGAARYHIEQLPARQSRRLTSDGKAVVRVERHYPDRELPIDKSALQALKSDGKAVMRVEGYYPNWQSTIGNGCASHPAAKPS